MPAAHDPGRPRLLFVTRDAWPFTRVDLNELFSQHLGQRLALTWLSPRAVAGPAMCERMASSERVLTPAKRGVAVGDMLATLRLNLATAVRVLRGEWDAVQVRDAVLAALLFLLAARIARRPFFYWMSFPIVEGFVHRARHPPPGANPVKRLAQLAYGRCGALILYRIILPAADHIFVQSARMKANVAAKGVPADRITPAPMGVSTERFNAERIVPTDDPRLQGRRALVYLGSMEPLRRLDILVAAVAAAARPRPDVSLVLVGERTPHEEAGLRAAAERDGFGGGLLFTGQLPLAEALRFVRAAAVCLSPVPLIDILLPASPTKLVEYLAMGRPVVANDHPDQALVLAESGAGLCVPYVADAFAEAIGRLLDDPAQAEAMAARGPAWVRRRRDYATLAQVVARAYAPWLDVGAFEAGEAA